MEALGISGSFPQSSIKTKADALKYAFDLTTERNYSTGETKVNTEKALEVFKAFTDNIVLPDCELTADNEIGKSLKEMLFNAAELIKNQKTDEQ